MRNKHTQSCGCLQKEISSLPPGEAAFNVLIRDYKRPAKNRDLVFDLSKEQIRELIKQNCHYCNCKPKKIKRVGPSVLVYNGIDRVDSNIGYVKENVVPCCWVCNRAKYTMSYDEFISWVSTVYNNIMEQDLQSQKK